MAPRKHAIMSFVIPVRDDAIRLDRCLASIRANTYPSESMEIIVADNGSTDRPADVACKHGARILHLPGTSLGSLRNAGVRASSGDLIAFVDADHEIVPEWVLCAVELFADPAVSAAGDAYRPPRPGTWVQATYDRLRHHSDGREKVDWLGSGNMVVRRAAFDAVGGFDESLETCEDVDLCRKLRAAGYAIVADSRMGNTHHGDPRTLRHVFLGELWRGRDNVRVSLRRPRTWRMLLSAAIPAVNLIAVAAMVVGLASRSRAGEALALAAIATTAVLIGARAVRMMRMRANVSDVLGAFSVAAAYEMGRAFAVAGLGTHRRRRSAAGQ